MSLFTRARSVLVGGVNSPVRAFSAVGGEPLFVDAGSGAYVHDAAGRALVDLVGSFGPAIVGHAHPAVVEAVVAAASRGLSFGACSAAEADLAEVILGALPGAERLRMVSSGTEAVMTAVRIARAATGRDRIVKFAGCYHGHADAFLVAAGSGAATSGVPDSAGVPAATAALTSLLPYNDAAAARELMDREGASVAAIVVEPVAGNMGLVLPEPGFLEALREGCDRRGALLILDEVMTGFRVAWGGWQVRAGLRADLTCLGKVIGGGLPAAAVAGPAELMELLSPVGPVYQAGTLSGSPLALAAGLATLRLCAEASFYERLEAASSRLADGWADAAGRAGVPLQTASIGGMAGLFFSDRPVRSFDDARRCNHARFARFFHAMLDRGVFMPPSPYEAMFVSSAHGPAEIDRVLDASAEAFEAISREEE